MNGVGDLAADLAGHRLESLMDSIDIRVSWNRDNNLQVPDVRCWSCFNNPGAAQHRIHFFGHDECDCVANLCTQLRVLASVSFTATSTALRAKKRVCVRAMAPARLLLLSH